MALPVLSGDPGIQLLIAIVLRALASVNIPAVAIRPADLPDSKDALDQMLRVRIASENPYQPRN
jgi:hypothetical protein